ncbi:MAG: ATP-binding cassette domain-containing protein, partial [Bdellovibrionales bacterium]|nr:ATP-binding cassette domain-containing protein [Bdellovibrionales bacterium]
MTDSSELIRAEGIKRHYELGDSTVRAVDGIDLSVKEGESLAIVGGSGGGKSTLLHILGTLDTPSEGKLYYRGDEISSLSEEKLATFRNQKLGFV